MQPHAFAFLTAALLFVGTWVHSQDFPTRPLRIVAPEVGGGADFVTRQIAQGLTASLGQQVVVENRGGASGAIAAQTVARALPDGYTLLLYSSSIWIVPLMQKNAPWDPVRDFRPITLATKQPNVLVVHPSLGVSSVKDLIALARAKPGALNYGTSGSGSSGHLAGELFKSMGGVDIIRVAYKGNAPALTDLVAGQIQMMFGTAASVAAHVKSGRVRALAVTSASPSPLVPGLPSVAASGLPGFEAESLLGMFAPAKTSASLVERLNREIVRVLHHADVKQRMLNAGVEPIGSTPAEFAAVMKAEVVRMGKVIREANIRID